MCLGVPGKIIALLDNHMAIVDVEGNQMEISLALLQEARAEQYVLIHAGFAMEIITEDVAEETMYYLMEMQKYANGA